MWVSFILEVSKSPLVLPTRRNFLENFEKVWNWFRIISAGGYLRSWGTENQRIFSVWPKYSWFSACCSHMALLNSFPSREICETALQKKGVCNFQSNAKTIFQILLKLSRLRFFSSFLKVFTILIIAGILPHKIETYKMTIWLSDYLTMWCWRRRKSREIGFF